MGADNRARFFGSGDIPVAVGPINHKGLVMKTLRFCFIVLLGIGHMN